jgi:hypothetical protein
MGGPIGGGYDWLSLLLVGLPGTVIGAITLALVLLDKARSRGSKDGKETVAILALEGRVTSLDEGFNAQGTALQQHLLDCAKIQGKMDEGQKNNSETLARLERSVDEMRRTISNWMRDRERSGRP